MKKILITTILKIIFIWNKIFIKISVLPIIGLQIIDYLFCKFLNNKFFRRKISYLMGTQIRENLVFSSYLRPKKINNNETQKTKLTHIDFGASGGLLNEVEINKNLFSKIIMCEGNSKSSEELKNLGFEVLHGFLGKKQNNVDFYEIKKNPGASSLFKPGDKKDLDFFALYGGEKYSDLHQEYSKTKVDIKEAYEEIKNFNLNSLDLIKLDVQGSERMILESIFSGANKNIIPFPLFIKCEVMFTPFYEKLKKGYSLISFINDQNYILIDQFDERYRNNIPIWCDCLFIPDWNTKFGQEMIKNNFNKFQILCEIYNKDYLFQFIAASLKKRDVL